ncbi:hypothetical protein PVK06_006894 [Gossypium arboreum]|uniref:UVR domain-containing protein n=1 Tax=Gossypium arboreum TaxID=29729 RepID=A0ABR0QFT5_GOSAR|nr:hypothetical protein PVK06_006894 [Gossypium arboreum]
MNQAQHIKASLDRQTTQQIATNRLRLKASRCFDIQNLQSQEYDGASKMREELNGLQTLILNECQYAYYVHCFAYRL